MSLFAAAVVFALLVASYSRRDSWLALCSTSMSMALILGCVFFSPDHDQVRKRFAWAASNLPLVLYRKIADDLVAALEHLAWRQAVNERDYLIKTIAFEASGEPEVAKIAVGYVILNRKKSGRWGDNIKDVVTHPGQFEPWMTRRREIEGLSPNDPRYRSAAVIADAVLSGRTPDPTAGATHFLNPTIVRERRGGSLPPWARGEGLSIGKHTFYFPEDDVSPQRAAVTMVDPPFMLRPESAGDLGVVGQAEAIAAHLGGLNRVTAP